MEGNVAFRFSFAGAATSPQPQKNSNFLSIAAEQSLLHLPPPSEEVFPSETEESSTCVMEPIILQGDLTLLKGRVKSRSVLKVANSDLVPGKYEGGLKLWECTIDLIETLRRETQDGQLSFRGKRVLELGCGHGLPGIFACLKGASTVHFQDFNVEVLKSLTIKNVQANLEQTRGGLVRVNSVNSDGIAANKSLTVTPDIHYYAGDWSDVHDVLSVVRCASVKNGDNEDVGTFNFMFNESERYEPVPESENNEVKSGGLSRSDSRTRFSRMLPESQACERGHITTTQDGGYDIILMSETVYSLASLPKLYELVKKCIRPHGVVYVAGKKHYFGVGGGTRQFKYLIEDDGVMAAHLVADFADGSSNVREIWKFFLHGLK